MTSEYRWSVNVVYDLKSKQVAALPNFQQRENIKKTLSSKNLTTIIKYRGQREYKIRRTEATFIQNIIIIVFIQLLLLMITA